MENSKVLKTANIKFDILEDGNLKVTIDCDNLTDLELLGFMEHTKFFILNNKIKNYE